MNNTSRIEPYFCCIDKIKLKVRVSKKEIEDFFKFNISDEFLPPDKSKAQSMLDKHKVKIERLEFLQNEYKLLLDKQVKLPKILERLKETYNNSEIVNKFELKQNIKNIKSELDRIQGKVLSLPNQIYQLQREVREYDEAPIQMELFSNLATDISFQLDKNPDLSLHMGHGMSEFKYRISFKDNCTTDFNNKNIIFESSFNIMFLHNSKIADKKGLYTDLYIEFNPQKCHSNKYLQPILWKFFSDINTTYVTMFDIAIDFEDVKTEFLYYDKKRKRNSKDFNYRNANLISSEYDEQKGVAKIEFECSKEDFKENLEKIVQRTLYNGKDNKTEYLGDGNGRLKVYNKQRELVDKMGFDIGHELTRFEYSFNFRSKDAFTIREYLSDDFYTFTRKLFIFADEEKKVVKDVFDVGLNSEIQDDCKKFGIEGIVVPYIERNIDNDLKNRSRNLKEFEEKYGFDFFDFVEKGSNVKKCVDEENLNICPIREVINSNSYSYKRGFLSSVKSQNLSDFYYLPPDDLGINLLDKNIDTEINLGELKATQRAILFALIKGYPIDELSRRTKPQYQALLNELNNKVKGFTEVERLGLFSVLNGYPVDSLSPSTKEKILDIMEGQSKIQVDFQEIISCCKTFFREYTNFIHPLRNAQNILHPIFMNSTTLRKDLA